MLGAECHRPAVSLLTRATAEKQRCWGECAARWEEHHCRRQPIRRRACSELAVRAASKRPDGTVGAQERRHIVGPRKLIDLTGPARNELRRVSLDERSVAELTMRIGSPRVEVAARIDREGAVTCGH